MRPAFSDALYYPTIDIQNTNWLKTAVLFWDSISTIVPESISQPYKQYDTQYLADIGFLRPLYVNPNDKSVIGIEEDMLNLLCSSEFIQALSNPQYSKFNGIWSDKMSYRVKEQVLELIDPIYGDKMSSRIQREVRRRIQHLNRYLEDQDIYYLDSEFVYIYMIALANKLCEDHSLGMITDDTPGFNIGNIVKLGNITSLRPEDHFRYMRPKDHQLEQGLLLNLIINGLSISPDAAFEDIVSFKNKHHDELSRFRTELANMTQKFDVDKPINIMQKEISDLYNNEFVPAFNDFKDALKSSRIRWFTDTFLKVSLFSASASGVPMALLGMPVEQAIFAGMGISVIASAVSYNANKYDFLRNNPYSYLLSVNREWS